MVFSLFKDKLNSYNELKELKKEAKEEALKEFKEERTKHIEEYKKELIDKEKEKYQNKLKQDLLSKSEKIKNRINYVRGKTSEFKDKLNNKESKFRNNMERISKNMYGK